ncbi:uncharacterized protein LOC111146063 [Enhydra lutris kenyoni]|uniref:Uncharacterized protein LOC111146063 n=1 Tax=Enhydra lutris kenyoni TaxID=391180 RepID=A0A2Y9JBV4_ENHLU|nr:uncharacterized protein LOC111146063 [Enhydra lutris kenyoni]
MCLEAVRSIVLSILGAAGLRVPEQIPGAHPAAHPEDCPPSAPTVTVAWELWKPFLGLRTPGSERRSCPPASSPHPWPSAKTGTGRQPGRITAPPGRPHCPLAQFPCCSHIRHRPVCAQPCTRDRDPHLQGSRDQPWPGARIPHTPSHPASLDLEWDLLTGHLTPHPPAPAQEGPTPRLLEMQVHMVEPPWEAPVQRILPRVQDDREMPTQLTELPLSFTPLPKVPSSEKASLTVLPRLARVRPAAVSHWSADTFLRVALVCAPGSPAASLSQWPRQIPEAAFAYRPLQPPARA